MADACLTLYPLIVGYNMAAAAQIPTTLLVRLVGLLAQFLRWWGDELAALIPASWRGSPAVLLSLGRRDVTITGLSEIVRLDAPLAALDSLQTDQFIRATRAREIDICMEDGVFRLDLHLPEAIQRSLASAVRYQLLAQSPVSINDCHYAYHILAKDKARKEITVRVVMTTLAQLGQLKDNLAHFGIQPRQIGASSVESSSTLDYVFERRAATSSDNPAQRTRVWLVAIVGVLLAILPAIQLSANWLAQRLDKQTSIMQADIRQQLQVRAEARALEQHGEMLAKRLIAPSPITTLNAIMAAHNARDWAEDINISSTRLSLTAHAGNPQELQKQLETQTALKGWRWRVVPSTQPTILEAVR
jgi:hypothetical protein